MDGLPPPPAASDSPGSVPVRHLELSDLPPAVAERVRFDRAAPRRLRSDRLPAPVHDELEHLWNGLVADVYDEVAGIRRFRGLSSGSVERVLRRVSDRILQAERVIIMAGVHYPMTNDKAGRHVALAGVGGASAAAAEELAVVGSVGTATAVAILTAVVGEVFETYVAASARTRAYQRAGRSPDPDLVVTDLAEAAGYASSVGRRASPALARDAAAWMSEVIIKRTATRFSRSLVPVAGVAIGAGMSMSNVRKTARAPLRPPTPDEVMRLADDIVNDTDTYVHSREEFLGLPDPPSDRD